MARPKQTSVRDRQLNIGLTDGEYQAIAARAHALGMRPVAYGRAMMLDARIAPAAAVDAPHRHERLVLLELQRLGNNLNQLVRRLHITGSTPPADLGPLLADVRAILSRALAPGLSAEGSQS
jgi:hypothetical protein